LVRPEYTWLRGKRGEEADCHRAVYPLNRQWCNKLVKLPLPLHITDLTRQCADIAETAINLQEKFNRNASEGLEVVRLLAKHRIAVFPTYKCHQSGTRFVSEPTLDLAYSTRKQDIIYFKEVNPKTLIGIPNSLYKQWRETHERKQAYEILKELREMGLYATSRPRWELEKFYR